MNDKKITILYGSQTGTAQDVAERLWREAKSYDFHGPVLSMDEYDIQNLIHEPVVVLVCSTTGQGDQPDNMKIFWKFLLRKSLPTNSLAKVKFAVLGLGDSSYVKFNFAAKKLYKRILQLGACPIMEPGYADDQHDMGIDAVVDPWISKLWESLSSYYPNLDLTSNITRLKLFPARWSVNVSEDETVNEEHLRNYDLMEENSALVCCLSNERVTPQDHFQDTRLIKFTSENLLYNPGDVLMARPKNNSISVNKFFDLFAEHNGEIRKSMILSVSKLYNDMPVPLVLEKPLTLRSLVEYYWDLNMVPRRYVFELLSHFTDSELEREKLIEFSSSSGQDERYTYCNRPKRTILEVLADFPHATKNLPLEYFFELFQPIRARAFSIASSPTAHAGELHILVAVVNYKTNLKLPRIGLCSNWLASLQKNDKIVVYIKKGSFSFSLAEKGFSIMVGPGTGIAPFRSFIQEDCKRNSIKRYIFFGCRGKRSDFYFEDEWAKLENDDKIKFFVSFSRDTPEKIYVQHIIKENRESIGKIVTDKNSCIFVAGNAKNMPQAVKEAFMSVYATATGLDENEVDKVFTKMELIGRYQTETWS